MPEQTTERRSRLAEPCVICTVKTGKAHPRCWYCRGKGCIEILLSPGFWEDRKGRVWHVFAVGHLYFPGQIGAHAVGILALADPPSFNDPNRYRLTSWLADGRASSSSVWDHDWDLIRKVGDAPPLPVWAPGSGEDGIAMGPEPSEALAEEATTTESEAK